MSGWTNGQEDEQYSENEWMDLRIAQKKVRDPKEGSAQKNKTYFGTSESPDWRAIARFKVEEAEKDFVKQNGRLAAALAKRKKDRLAAALAKQKQLATALAKKRKEEKKLAAALAKERKEERMLAAALTKKRKDEQILAAALTKKKRDEKMLAAALAKNSREEKKKIKKHGMDLRGK